MRFAFVCVAFLLGFSSATAESGKPEISWRKDPRTGVYTNVQTGLSFPLEIAGFKQTRATPAGKDGGASFAYACDDGVVTLYLTHRLIHGFTDTEGATAKFRDMFLAIMRKAHGEADLDQAFTFVFSHGDKTYSGKGGTVHFVRSPLLKSAAYSEFGTVLVGDFFYYYRATFAHARGLEQLAVFLTELNVRDRAAEVTPAAL